MGSINNIINSILSKTFQDTLIPGLNIIKSITIKQADIGNYDTSTGDSSYTTNDFVVNAAIRELNFKEIQSINANRQSLAEDGDLLLTVGLVDQTTPDSLSMDDIILINDDNYIIIDYKTKQLAGSDLVWLIIARKI